MTISDERLVTRRPLLVAAVVLLAAAVAVPALRYLWNSADGHPCVPDAGGAFEQLVPRGLLPPVLEAERDPSIIAEDTCITEQSAYSITPDGGSSLGLTVSYERFEVTWRESGASLASHRLADRRPSDAKMLDFGDQGYGEEGYVDAAALGGYSSVELLIRDDNVLVMVSYRADQPLSRATSTAERVADAMLEELNDYRSG